MALRHRLTLLAAATVGVTVVLVATIAYLVLRTLRLTAFHDTQCGLKAFRSDAARLVFGLGRIDGRPVGTFAFSRGDSRGVSRPIG